MAGAGRFPKTPSRGWLPQNLPREIHNMLQEVNWLARYEPYEQVPSGQVTLFALENMVLLWMTAVDIARHLPA